MTRITIYNTQIQDSSARNKSKKSARQWAILCNHNIDIMEILRYKTATSVHNTFYYYH